MTKKLIGYIRVSTDEQGKSGNGLDAQKAAIEKFAAENGYELTEVVEEWASGKLGLEDRPKLASCVAKSLKQGVTIVVSKLDRLSREVAFISNLMTTKAKFIVVSLGEDVDPFMLHLYAAFAEQERKVIGERTKAALEALKAKGVRLGHVNHKDPAAVVLARLKGNETAKVKADEFAEKMKPMILRMLNAKMGYSAIAAELNENNIKTARGKSWGAQTIINMEARWGRGE